MSIASAVATMGAAVVLTTLIGWALVRPLRSWQWIRRPKSASRLGIAGVLGGIITASLIFQIGDTFGFPGSTDYLVYERFNRAMAFLLALQACAILALISAVFDKVSRFSQTAVALVLAGWMAMVIGTAAEFWLFSGLPYGEFNMRDFSFSLFSIGSLLAGISMLVVGIRILIRRKTAWYFGAIFLLYLPVDAAMFVRGDSIFITSALAAVAIGLLVLLDGRQSAVAGGELA